MPRENELPARLEQWLADRSEPPTLFDVLATGDHELFAAFILKGFRAAARQAVIERFEREAATTFASEPMTATAVVLRLFDGLAGAWSLDVGERLALLGLGDAAELQSLRSMPLDEVPTEIIERVAILLDIFKAINTLLPVPSRADAWIRAPNRASIFGGRSALELMIDGRLEGLRKVRACLQAHVLSCPTSDLTRDAPPWSELVRKGGA